MKRRKAPPQEPKEVIAPGAEGAFLVASFKDIGDIIRTKTLFFVPFFGAFVVFLLSKSDFILSGSTLWVKLGCGVVFLSELHMLTWSGSYFGGWRP
jgi:hypothetical protein